MKQTLLFGRMIGLIAILALLVGVFAVSAQDERILVVGHAESTDSLDPARGFTGTTGIVNKAAYETLVTFPDEDASSIEPLLATEWEISEDGLTYTFTLREDVVFHDGSPMTASDVVFSMQRLQNVSGNPSFLADNIASVEAIDDLTVAITLASVNPSFLAELPNYAFSVSSAELIMANGGTDAEDAAETDAAEDFLNSISAGTGPYILDGWDPLVRTELIRNENYWGEGGTIQNVTFRPIPETSTRVAALQAGDVDIIVNVPAFRQEEINATENLEIRAVPSTFFQYVALDGTKNEVLADVRVRQAIQYATNVPEIVEFLFYGPAQQIAFPLAFGTFGLDESIEPYPYDLERARELLAEAGYPDGITFALDAPTGRYAQDREVAEALVGQWAQAGINVELNINAWADQLAKYRDGDALVESHFMGWGTSTFDADDVLFGAFANVPNKNNYVNEEVTELVLQARNTFDDAERAELYAQVQQIIYQEVPWISLFQQFDIYGVRADLNWQPRQDQKIEVRTISLG